MKYQRILTGLIAVVAGCTLAFVPASQAQAWFFGSHGSWGSHGSSGGSWGSHGSSGGSWGSHGSSGGSSGGYSSYGYGSQSYSSRSAPTNYVASRDARLTVEVPETAKVTVNGQLTKSEGASRRFVSPNLKRGREYRYEIRAEMERDGQVVETTKVIQLRGGENRRVAMTFDGSEQVAAESVQTKLTVTVPENAQVKLAGNDSSLIGSSRTYTTSRLDTGDKWSNYRVQVTLQLDGQAVTREKSITLTGGEMHTVAFDFDAPQVADSNELATR